MRRRPLTSSFALIIVLVFGPLQAMAQEATPMVSPHAGAACSTPVFVPDPPGDWDHPHKTPLLAIGSPVHTAQDVLAVAGNPITIEGKFAYGLLSKDLEHESVRAFLGTCDGWTFVGQATTDGDGRARVAVPDGLGPGIYGIAFEVVGDASLARATLSVMPRGTHLAIFDVDGTLTRSDEEIVRDVFVDLFEPLALGDYVPQAYPGAAALTLAEAARGHLVVYLTGRPYWLMDITRTWLADGFAPGVLHVADSDAEALPIPEGVGAFKQAFLADLAAAGFVLDVAYGNAATDVDAYLRAGLAPDAVFIIGRHGGERGTHAVADSWEERATAVAALPPVAPPGS